MKKITTFFALSLFAFAFNSCDAVKDLAPDVTLEDDFSASVPIVMVEGSSDVEGTFNIDASGDPDFQEYKDNIKSVDITGFTYEVTNVTSGSGSVLNGTISASGESVTISNFTISEGESGTVTSAESDFFNALAQDLKADGKVNITLDGSIDTDSGANFTLKITPTIKFIFSVL